MVRDWNSQKDRLARIQEKIAAEGRIRQGLLSEAIRKRIEGNCDREVAAIQKIGDSWLLSETEMLAGLISDSDFGSRGALEARIRELESIDAAISRFLGDDIQTRIKWLRSPSSALGGFQPIDYIQASRGDLSRVVQAVREEKGC